jgi:hypothetical protein
MQYCTRIAVVLSASLIAQFGLARTGLAQTTISTDRPAVTDSSAVVSAGLFQMENGFLDSAGSRDFPESLIRYGMTSSTEIRITVPDYFNGPGMNGFGDLQLGVKQQLTNGVAGFQVAAVVSLSLPTGARTVSSHGYDPSFQVPWSRKLSENWTAAGMLSLYVPTVNGTHQAVGESTFLFDRQLTKACDAFVEYVGDFPESGGPRHLIHFGTAYKIGDQQQLDLHVGVGLSSAAVHHYIGIGYSFALRTPRP